MEKGLRKFFWGFLFIMMNVRINGFDILPDVIGYAFLAVGFYQLSEESYYFRLAAKFNIPMVLLSLLTLHQQTASLDQTATPLFFFNGVVFVAEFALNLYIVYNLFMGVAEMVGDMQHGCLADEAKRCWDQYKWLLTVTLLSFIFMVIPIINVLIGIGLFVWSLVLMINIMKFLDKCRTEYMQMKMV